MFVTTALTDVIESGGGGFVIKDDFWVELEDTNLRLANVELDGPRDDYDRTRGSSLGD